MVTVILVDDKVGQKQAERLFSGFSVRTIVIAPAHENEAHKDSALLQTIPLYIEEATELLDE